ncbi:tyrosine-type recombinase/integrase [Primorskyibacter sp. 2E107]|uniref:tyrosine-type recombinase/integrase n=1 Tax=Primorskyibacter sp. 2E107 TaxID=3403458 RepID=UPI003AF9ADFA
MATPEVLIGTESPWTSRPFGKEIKLGLNTRNHAEAVRVRDIRIGQIRQLEAEAEASAGKKTVGKIIDLTPENAAEWRAMRAESSNPEGLDHILIDKLEHAAEAGKEREASAFGQMVFKGAVPLSDALKMYLEDRSEGNPYGFDPLATTTALDVKTSVRHLSKFLDTETPILPDITADVAFRFRTQYLPLVAKVGPKTIAKHMTLLRGLWAWAIEDKKLLRGQRGRPIRNPWNIVTKGTPKTKASRPRPEESRAAFTPEEVTALFEGTRQQGSREGDIVRLALATGCRADEIGSLHLRHVRSDGSGFDIAKGKTDNARRFVPVVEEAQRLLKNRIREATAKQAGTPEDTMRLFPEWPLKPSTQKANSVSQWFTRYRRATLGANSDGRLVMHSFRHTWRTIARRGGVPEDRIHELGGWEGDKTTSRVYDHGLTEDQLTKAQQEVWVSLRDAGYLDAF